MIIFQATHDDSGEPTPITVTHYPSGISTVSAMVKDRLCTIRFIGDGECDYDLASDFASAYGLTIEGDDDA